MNLVFTAEARRDLFEIGDYIAKDNRNQALNFVLELENFCAALVSQPERYPRMTRYPLLRRAACRNYLVFYRVKEQAVEIVRLLHGARNIDEILETQSDR